MSPGKDSTQYVWKKTMCVTLWDQSKVAISFSFLSQGEFSMLTDLYEQTEFTQQVVIRTSKVEEAFYVKTARFIEWMDFTISSWLSSKGSDFIFFIPWDGLD